MVEDEADCGSVLSEVNAQFPHKNRLLFTCSNTQFKPFGTLSLQPMFEFAYRFTIVHDQSIWSIIARVCLQSSISLAFRGPSAITNRLAGLTTANACTNCCVQCGRLNINMATGV